MFCLKHLNYSKGTKLHIYMFNGRNILSDFPEELTKVVTFLNQKASLGEFNFCDSFDEWGENEDIIKPLNLGIYGGTYYYAVSLAYIANLNEGKIKVPTDCKIYRWVWSLHILAEFADWNAWFMGRVINSFYGYNDNIEGLLGRAGHVFARTNFEKGRSLSDTIDVLQSNIHAGLMENDFQRYCDIYPPCENQNTFSSAYCMTDALPKNVHEKAFDYFVGFTSYKSNVSMAFLLKVHSELIGERKNDSEDLIKQLLSNNDVREYANAIYNWITNDNDDKSFVEHIIFLFIQGLGENDENYLKMIDDSLAWCHFDFEFLTAIIVNISEYISPLDVLIMENCLHQMYEDREHFVTIVVKYIIHHKGEARTLGRRLWDDYHLESTNIDISIMSEIEQIAFIYSMLQDFGNPKTRLPKILPLLKTGNDNVKNFLMNRLLQYTDEYMGHVVAECDKLKLKNENIKIIKDYVEKRSDIIKERKEMKELSPIYKYGREFREASRIEREYYQNMMKEAKDKSHSMWKEFANTVVLARGGGWRRQDGTTQKLPLIQFSTPAPIMNESLSPMEQQEWYNDLFRDWNDTTGNH